MRQAKQFAATGCPNYHTLMNGRPAAFRPINNPSAQRAPSGWERVVPDASNVVIDDDDDDVEFALVVNTNDNPQSLADAQSRNDWPEWKSAMDCEIAQLQRLRTYELTPCPPDRKPIGCKWVFHLKRDSEGRIVKHKARLVAQGFSQIPGIDYVETFAPVVCLEMIRILLALGTTLKLDMQVVDVIGAYLNGHLRQEIYMRQPPMYENGRPDACRFLRTLYGLKQSGREWNTELDASFAKLGFKRLISDQCIYLRTSGDKIWIIGCHVDDMLTLASSPAELDALHRELAEHFEISKLGQVRQIVGIEVDRDRHTGTLTIRQTQYFDRLLTRFGMTDANPVDTPLDPNVRLRTHDATADPDARAHYQSIVSSLMYAAMGTRPDIAHAVQQLSQYASNPGPAHLTAAKRVLHYIKGTRTLGIMYHGRANQIEPIGYSDVDWGNNLDDRKSISRQVFLLAGAPVTWSSRKQRTVAKSTMEAEYMAASAAASEATWLWSLLSELGLPQTDLTPLYVNNQSAIASANTQTSHARTKHIDIHYHYIREPITSNEVTVSHCPSEDNLADALTKALPRPRSRRRFPGRAINHLSRAWECALDTRRQGGVSEAEKHRCAA